MSEPPQENLLSPEPPPDEELEEVLREVQRGELFENISKEIAKFNWQIVEERDPKTGLIGHVLINEDGDTLYRISHDEKSVAALVVQAFVMGALQARDEMRQEYGEQMLKLERWCPKTSSEIN